ncbi:MAG TPA: TonB-dependent receptor [Acidobacteriota bacterium]|nr:TonB-dependent receptor [Acidobacteriota bacterium]
MRPEIHLEILREFWRFLASMKTSLLFLIIICFQISVSIEAASAEGPLRGRVEDGSGRPIHEVVIEVLVPSTLERAGRAISDHEGRFTFSDLPPGPLELVAVKRGLGLTTVVVEEAARGQEVVILLVEELPRVATELSVFGAIPRTAASSSVFRREEFNRRVIEDTGEILRVVPALTVVQHAGGGKSNQYLIRGFDADHGTDFAVSFAGIPVNMVSHAHGQGYADMNFVIPETLETIDVYKGPYFAELGNLATAGAAVLQLRDEFEHSFVKVEGGQFDAGRALVGWSPKVDWTKGFLAIESRYTNGPFNDPQAFRRLNVTTRWTFNLTSDQTLSLLGTGYGGKWNQSGQIPLREVTAGRLDRFDSIDEHEGGDSSRYNFSISHQKLWANQALNSQFYAFHYEMDLYSNFTFFASDPERGDGILQKDDRKVIGGHVQHHYHHELGSLPSLFTVGLDYRHDFADVGLFRQQERRVFDTIVNSHIVERNLGFYAQDEIELHPSLKAILGVRHDRFHFDVEDLGGEQLRGTESRNITGPKMSLIYAPWGNGGGNFYANYGRGFHSNDARSVVADPLSVALAAADGYELGYRQIFAGRLELSAAYWLLDLESELVFVGDEGTTEINGPTRRHGPELEVKWKFNDSLWIDMESSYSRGHFRGTDEVIPRAPRLVTSGGLSFATARGFTGNLRFRQVGDHPLVEDNSVQAEGYTVIDLYLNYPFTDRWKGILAIENLFDVEYKQAQTYFESRLPSEPFPVADNHFNPGNPFGLRLGLQYSF